MMNDVGLRGATAIDNIGCARKDARTTVQCCAALFLASGGDVEYDGEPGDNQAERTGRGIITQRYMALL